MYSFTFAKPFSKLALKFSLFIFIAGFTCAGVFAQSSNTLSPVADAYIRSGSYASANYGSDTGLIVKGASSSYARSSYIKFSLSSLSNISSAKLRLYGRNTDNTSSVSVSAYSVDNDSWTENGITYNNAPAATSPALGSASVSNQGQFYEFDASNYVINQFAGDKTVSFLITDPNNKNTNIVFNSRENTANSPQLVVTTSSSGGASSPVNSLIFIENTDHFPANDRFVFSKIQVPWTRDSVYTVNHDSVRIRIHNKGIDPLTINKFVLSNTSAWRIENIKGVRYIPGSSLPLTVSSGTYADLMVKFIAVNQATRIKVLHDSLTIVSNDNKFPSKIISLNGIWQKQGEGLNEPSTQDIISAFNFKTSTGFTQTDGDKGDTTRLKGSEIRPSYFISADTSKPVSVIQIAAYHGCCNTLPERIIWYPKGSPSTLNTLFTHVLVDGQTVLPRKGKPSTPAEATFTPKTAFGIKVGSRNFTDASINPGGKIGVKVWKALDAAGNVIPNSYIIANDYLGTTSTNYDYNDNLYFIKNVRPERGTAFFSTLDAAPSALDFGEKILQSTNNALTLNLKNLGKTYSDGSSDPATVISSIIITGENASEFSVSMPAKTTLNPQENTALTVNFKPVSQGLKIADLLVYYNNSQSPLRVPLYAIAKAFGTTVTANYRVNSGSSTAININGKTWSADNQYVFDNLEPYTNTRLTKINGTEEDLLYVKEQSSNADKAPFRYEFPVANGDYVVRLHFAELYWGAPGSGFAGGAGSRVMDVSLENKLRLINFDVTQEVGSATALVKNLPVTVTDGKLNINFSATVNRPMVVAVEVYSFRTSALAKPAGTDSLNVVSLEKTVKKVRVYPNPLQKRMMIEFPNNYTGNTNLQIMDAIGRTFNLGQVKLQPGTSNVQIDISHLLLQPGFYYLKVTSETKKTEVIKLIVR